MREFCVARDERDNSSGERFGSQTVLGLIG